MRPHLCAVNSGHTARVLCMAPRHVDVVKSLKYFIGGVGERQPTSPSASTGCTGST